MSDLRAAQMAVFERWFGPPSDGMSAATRRAIADELAALVASATEEELRAALKRISDLTLDVPAAHGNPESYYLGQLRTAIGTAARALAASTTKDPK